MERCEHELMNPLEMARLGDAWSPMPVGKTRDNDTNNVNNLTAGLMKYQGCNLKIPGVWLY